MKTKSRKSIFLSATSVVMIAFSGGAFAAELWWDGGTVDIGTNGDGVSAGGTGTWNTTLTNWDQGSGLAHVAWDNAGNNTAIFGGGLGSLTLGAPVSANRLLITPTSGTLSLSGSNALTLSGTSPTIVAGTTTNISTAIIGSNGLSKSGAGSVAIKSLVSNSGFTGGLTINQGIVELDLNSMSAGNSTDMIASTNTLSLNGGYLRVRAKTGATNSQTLGEVTLNGTTGINITHQTGAGTVTALNLGTINRNAGSTLSITTPTNGTSGDINVPVGTNLGNWAVISSPASGLGAAAPINYATVDGAGKVIAVTGSGAATADNLADQANGANYDLAVATGSVPAIVNANSIRYTGALGTTTLGTSSFTVNSLMNGGIGTGMWTIGVAGASRGTLIIGTNQELIVHGGERGVTINSDIVNNSAGTSAVTINSQINGTNGASGVVTTLNGVNTYTGRTTINGSNVFNSTGHVVGNTFADAGSAFGAGGDLVLNGATLKTTPTSAQTTNRNITLSGNSAIYIANSTLTQTVTLAGNISGSGTFTVDQNATSGALILSGDNSYSGEFLLNQTDGKLTIASANAAKNATLNIAGQRASFAFTGDKAFNIGGLKGNALNLNLGTGLADGGSGMVSIGSNNQSNVFQGALSGDAGLVKQGTGTQTLIQNSYLGKTVIEGGTLKLGSVSQTTFAGNMVVDNDSTYGRNRVKIASTGGYAASLAYAVGQTVKIGTDANNEIYGIGYDTGSIYLYLKNSATLGTTLSGSIEAMKGSIASTTIEVQPGAFLDVSAVNNFTLGADQRLTGSGTVIGSMTVAGTLSPGASPGTLHTDSQTWVDGGSYNWQFYEAAAGGYDSIVINGTLDLTQLTAGGFNINLWSLAGIGPDVDGNAIDFDNSTNYAWSILSASGGISGFDANNITINTGAINGIGGFSNGLGGGSFSLTQNGNDLRLNFNAAAVPEPSALLLGGFGLFALTFRRRR